MSKKGIIISVIFGVFSILVSIGSFVLGFQHGKLDFWPTMAGYLILSSLYLVWFFTKNKFWLSALALINLPLALLLFVNLPTPLSYRFALTLLELNFGLIMLGNAYAYPARPTHN